MVSVFTVSGYKHGFVRALISLLGAIFSLGIAVYLSSIISNYIYMNFIQPGLLEKVNDIILSEPQEIREKFESIPKIILNGFESYGITFEKINHIIINDKVNAAGLIVELFSPIMINFIKVISTTFLFSVFIVLVRIVTKTIGKLFKLPILRQIDGLLGAVFGFFKGCVVLMILMLFLRIVLPSMSKEPYVLSEENIDKTYFFKGLYYNNPAYGVFREM